MSKQCRCRIMLKALMLKALITTHKHISILLSLGMVNGAPEQGGLTIAPRERLVADPPEWVEGDILVVSGRHVDEELEDAHNRYNTAAIHGVLLPVCGGLNSVLGGGALARELHSALGAGLESPAGNLRESSHPCCSSPC